MHLLQANEHNGQHNWQLWMTLSPVVRRRVSELSRVTSVFHREALLDVLWFFDSLDVAQLNCAFCCTDINTLRQLMGTGCSPPTLTMMHMLIWFLTQNYPGSD